MSRQSPAVKRVAAILEFLADHPEELMSLSEISRSAGLSAATAHAMLNGLADEGLLIKDPSSKKYGLGPTLVRLGRAAGARDDDVQAIAQAEINRLNEEIGRHIVATRVIGRHVVIVKQAGNVGPWSMTVQVGHRVEFRPPIGTVFLAWSDNADVEKWLRQVDAVASDAAIARCLEALEGVRRRGYAAARNVAEDNEQRAESGQALGAGLDTLLAGEYFLNEIDDEQYYSMIQTAAPVFDAHGQVTLAIASSYAGTVISGRSVRAEAEAVVAAAGRVTRCIHGRMPDGLGG
ncbi:hypothetical protein C5E45_19560 [Nocardia nova]|uniref:IclR family transcriptional regulator n=1 Tax=Nocardia nova TaxID=37330 RepID=A0A2S6AN18_9NOCA|nr:helix-turn-helix domain-containing protein [Nocardia nova]PPJ25759.1 hypothetical protein C5E41_18970 [Nocardia nova]PPJ36612.1 hypothetical protein C5E45_19560 [Nocardia nova]